MTDFKKLVPAHMQKLAIYKPGKAVRQAELETGVRCIKMASNENPFGPSPLAIEAIKAATSDSHFYPDNGVAELTARLAEIHEVDPTQILVTAGSTTLLDILARTLLGPGLNAVTSKLSFIVYPIVTQAAGARLIEVPTLNDGYDLKAFSRQSTPTLVWCISRIPTIRRERSWTLPPLIAFWIGCPRMSSPYWTRRIAIMPATSQPSVVWTTRTDSNTCGLGGRLSCCGLSQSPTGWQDFAWATESVRQS